MLFPPIIPLGFVYSQMICFSTWRHHFEHVFVVISSCAFSECNRCLRRGHLHAAAEGEVHRPVRRHRCQCLAKHRPKGIITSVDHLHRRHRHHHNHHHRISTPPSHCPPPPVSPLSPPPTVPSSSSSSYLYSSSSYSSLSLSPSPPPPNVIPVIITVQHGHSHPPEMIAIVRARAKPWYELSHYIQALTLLGISPTKIADATGVSPIEQSNYHVQVRSAGDPNRFGIFRIGSPNFGSKRNRNNCTLSLPLCQCSEQGTFRPKSRPSAEDPGDLFQFDLTSRVCRF